MAEDAKNRKRKAVTRDVVAGDVAVPGEEFRNGSFDGIFSESEPESYHSGSASEDEDEFESGFQGEEEDLEDEEDEDSDDEEVREQILALKAVGLREAEDEGEEQSFPLQETASPELNDGAIENINGRMIDLETNYTVTKDANGGSRYIYKEIQPVYDSDDSDAAAAANTIGDIPLSFYDAYPHIGYDINGKRIMRPAKGNALDALLDSIEIPKGWTGLTDPTTGKSLQLSEGELDILKKITRNEIPEEGYDPYPDYVDWFTSKTEIMPLSAAPEPKRRFVPSKNEAKRVMKIVKAIREGRIKPYRDPTEEEQQDPDVKTYDIWADETPRPDHIMNVPAPKLPPPGYEDSYHPPPEYLPDKEEKATWEAADPEDRNTDYLPTDHGSLRKVPGYDNVKMVFNRCLDLYLAPRVRRSKLNIDPESLLPKLPNPDELRPFPTACATVFRGHEGRVRSVSIDPSGDLLASGGDDGSVRVWEVLTGRQVWSRKLSHDGAVDAVAWRPAKEGFILAAACQENLYFIVPYGLHLLGPDVEQTSRDIIDAAFGYEASKPTTDVNIKKEPAAKWMRPSPKMVDSGVLLMATLRSPIKVVTWHRRGDYLATVAPRGQSHAVAIHTLSKHLTQLPFRRLKGHPQTAQFHPSKPIFFVATQLSVRSYDLSQQVLLKHLKPGARWVSSIDVHPGGDNLIVGSYDRRLLWHDLDLSIYPYKTLRYHQKAIRAVKFHHGGFPLFADCSDDGTVQIFHGKVVSDLMENATIVPLKVLRGHQVQGALGVLALDWHPRHPWVVSAGADGTCRLWC